MKRCQPGLLTIFLTFCLVIMFSFVKGYPQERREQEEPQKLNINTATVEELSSLPKISVREAEGIIIYREKYGPFKKIEDINKVPGIEWREYRAVKDMITVE